jgi:hypothetical protein
MPVNLIKSKIIYKPQIGLDLRAPLIINKRDKAETLI